MIEELLANLQLTPTIQVIVGITAVLCLWLGWTFRGLGRKRREAALKKEVMAAKASVPQLELNVRHRDQQITNISQSLAEFKKENATLARRTEQAEKEMRTAQRQVSNLTSEVNAVKGVSKGADNLIIAGFDDEPDPEEADESPLVARLRKTEAAYEKLKGALIKRDDRIDDLEEKLHAIEEDASRPTDEGKDQSPALQAEVDQARETIVALQSQLLDARQEKEMLEELASRRSKSNRALKETTAEAQQQVPALQSQLEEHLETIAHREASISRLLKDVETKKAELKAQLDQTQTLEQELAARTNTLTETQTRVVALQEELSSRDQHIGQLDNALAQSAESITDLEKQIEAAESATRLHQEAVNALAEANTQKQKLEEVITQRNTKLASLNADLDRLGAQFSASKEQAAEAALTAEQRCSEAEEQTAASQSHIQRLKFELEDASATIAQQARWMEKLKKSKRDREAASAQLEQQVETLTAQVNIANAEVQYQQLALETMEAEKREQNAEPTGTPTKVIQITRTSALDGAANRVPRLYLKGAKSRRLSKRRKLPAAAQLKMRGAGTVQSRKRRQAARTRPVRVSQKKKRFC